MPHPSLTFHQSIRIVLVQTSHPGNIGAAARVMKNMGLNQLYLVGPKLFPHADATAMAAGADNLLHHAIICPTLEDALKGCRLVFGTTARTRKIKHKIVEPKEAANIAANVVNLGEVAFVFGRERTGLSNDEVDQCEVLINIPTVDEFSSLNIASAVQVMCYEVFLALRTIDQAKSVQLLSDLSLLASHDELEAFFQHLVSALVEIDFLDPKKSPQIMPKLKHLFHRSELRQSEINILRGVCSAILKNAKV